MSPLVTILLYVVIPLAGFLLIAAVVALRPSARRGGATRYRSGGPWDHEPLWWMANPEGSGVPAPPGAGDPPSALTTLRTARGGARGTW